MKTDPDSVSGAPESRGDKMGGIPWLFEAKKNGHVAGHKKQARKQCQLPAEQLFSGHQHLWLFSEQNTNKKIFDLHWKSLCGRWTPSVQRNGSWKNCSKGVLTHISSFIFEMLSLKKIDILADISHKPSWNQAVTRSSRKLQMVDAGKKTAQKICCLAEKVSFKKNHKTLAISMWQMKIGNPQTTRGILLLKRCI